MPNKSSAQSVSQSTTRSTPVLEVLERIQVRDPNHKIAGYRRRMEDYEVQWHVQRWATVGLAVALIASGLSWYQRREPAKMATVPIMERPIQPQAHEPLPVPKGLHTNPEPRRAQTPIASVPVLPSPENLRAQFLGPETVELRWDPLGEGYRYMVYSALSPTMKDAQPILEQPIPADFAVWMPSNELDSIWMTVQGITPEGNLTPWSQPLFIQLSQF